MSAPPGYPPRQTVDPGSAGGYFSGTEGAIRQIQWRVGAKLYPARKSRKRFERPDLVRQALTGG